MFYVLCFNQPTMRASVVHQDDLLQDVLGGAVDDAA